MLVHPVVVGSKAFVFKVLVGSGRGCLIRYCLVLMGFRYLASSIPIICLTGVAIGVGAIFSSLIIAISRNPAITNNLILWLRFYHLQLGIAQ